MTTKTSTSTLPETKKTNQKNDGKTQRPSPASRRSATTSPAGQGSSARVSSRSRESGGGLFYRFLASLFAFRLFSPSSLSPPSLSPPSLSSPSLMLSTSLSCPQSSQLSRTQPTISPPKTKTSPVRPGRARAAGLARGPESRGGGRVLGATGPRGRARARRGGERPRGGPRGAGRGRGREAEEDGGAEGRAVAVRAHARAAVCDAAGRGGGRRGRRGKAAATGDGAAAQRERGA